ncbi:MAG: SGNH/GDSL hydrolase family protein [Candidatus Saccharibacteria bacterium]
MNKPASFNISFSLHNRWIVIVACCLLLVSCSILKPHKSSSLQNWVGTWGTAPQLVEPGNMPPAPGLNNNTIRQVVRVSLGGDSLRVKFSNEYSQSPVTMNAVQVAVSKGGSLINATTVKVLRFKGSKNITMAPGTAIVSDPVAFPLTPRMDVAITISFGQTSQTVTGHPGSRTTSYILQGDKIASVDFAGSVNTDHWYVINGIDVKAPVNAAAIAIIGNSITDGRGSETNKQNRWPDILSERLLKNPSTAHISVLNMGIGGNCVLKSCLGPSAISRFERDILSQKGIRWAVVFEGVNDLGGASDNTADQIAKDLIEAYKKMVALAHERNIKIFGATIMPFKNHSYYTSARDQARNTVNEWIRNSGRFDGVIDFDKTMQDPLDHTTLLPAVQSDYLHPNAAGHRVMGESVDLELFK